MSSSKHDDPKIGQILIEQKLASTSEVAEAIVAQKETEAKTGQRLKLGQILLFMKVLTLDQLQGALRLQKNKSQAFLNKSIASKEASAATKSAYESFVKFKPGKEAAKEERGFISGLKKIFKGK